MSKVVMLENVDYKKNGKMKTLKQGETYRLTSRLGCQYGVILNEDGYIVVPGRAIKSVKEN